MRTFVAGVAVLLAAFTVQAQPLQPLSTLAQRTHFHGLAVDPVDSTRLLLATHHGFYSVTMRGQVNRLSRDAHDFMGFTTHPADPRVLYASGHPASGGNLGFLRSEDGGRTWRQVSPGYQGPVDFHQMDVSRSDPSRIYGVYGALQTSRDSGKTWQLVGPVPAGLTDLAVAPGNAETLYAGTQVGLFVSRDGGRSWQRTAVNVPISLVQATPDGSLFLFAVGRGLMRLGSSSSEWVPISNGFGERVPLHLAMPAGDSTRLFIADHRNGLLESSDGGVTWRELGAPQELPRN